MIDAVVVCFNPDNERLAKVLHAVERDVNHIWLIDNSDDPSRQVNLLHEQITHIPQTQNIGIAEAQNIGLRKALENGAQQILLLDHDSVMDEGAIEKMLSILAEDEKIAAVGCNYRMGDKDVPSVFVLEGWFRFKRVPVSQLAEKKRVSVDFMIASGSLLNRYALEQVGLMNGDYFIDHVDTEWCLRARQKEFHLVGAPQAKMSHSLGERVCSIRLLGRERFIPYHRSFRYYYIFRNSMWLYKKPFTSIKFISADVVRLISILVVCILFTKDRMEGVKMVWNGLIDGFTNSSKRAPLKPIPA